MCRRGSTRPLAADAPRTHSPSTTTTRRHTHSTQDPCRSFVLRDVICEYCNDCRELDLCRDPRLLEHRWLCPCCANKYSMAAVEGRLLAVVAAQQRAYQLQDLSCVRCRNVSSAHLKQCCDQCGGALANSVPPADMAEQLRLFRSIAQFHNFDLLLSVVDGLLLPGGMLAAGGGGAAELGV